MSLVFSLDVGDHIPTLQLMWPGWDTALREEDRGPPQTVKPHRALSSWMELEGPLCPSLWSSCEQETLTRRKVCLLIFGGVTVLGGGPRAHTPHPEALPNPLGASSFSFDFCGLLWFHEACELRPLTRVPPPSRSCWRSFQDGAVVSSSPRLLLGKSLARRGLFFLGDSVGRWMWPGWSSSHGLLPPPRELASQPWAPSGWSPHHHHHQGRFWGLSTGRRQIQPNTGFSLSSLPGGESGEANVNLLSPDVRAHSPPPFVGS